MMGMPLPQVLHTHPLLLACLQLALVIPILILNRNYFTVGFSRLVKLSPNMDSLVAVGAAAGLVYSLIEMGLLAAGQVSGMPDLYFESAGMILTLVTVGKYLEERSRGKTTGAISALLALAPEVPWCAVRDRSSPSPRRRSWPVTPSSSVRAAASPWTVSSPTATPP